MYVQARGHGPVASSEMIVRCRPCVHVFGRGLLACLLMDCVINGPVLWQWHAASKLGLCL